MTQLFYVGQIKPKLQCKDHWEFQGIFDDEKLAIAACKNENYFYHEIEINKELPAETIVIDPKWPIAKTQSSDFNERQQIARRMADVMVERMRTTGDCTDDDLRQAGFTDDTIARCYRLAVAMAGVTINANPKTH